MKSNSTEAVGRERDAGSTRENRTGIMVNPELSAQLILGAEAATATASDAAAKVTDRASYLTEASAIGSLPALVAGEGEGNASPSSFLDKIRERPSLARPGTRVY